ncbi:serine/threonine-protein kinase [Actinophytocola oryzae]|uniref:serine/threonine-protein kinase n=1 Tax=Actinophytocola oryzae TaxID=502181 RepID=UPI001FBA23B1|nr:serine/threonine-protein kinase [Actinophytocola oryzae]
MTQDQLRATERVVAGRYSLVREIGRGGMGIVWLAEDRTIGRRVAIKELHLPDDVDPAERTVFEERVLREARAAGRLNDPGVVTVFDVVRESGTTFIVMELIQAPTLAQLVEQRGPLPQGAVTRLAEQLLSALEVAHAAGVVHRDVKPSNIMVTPNGRVKLTDFGIAQSTDDPRLTTSGILVGSPVYMAPERLRGHDADAGSDLWSLGAVLFFAVEGYDAFERSSTAASMNAILNEVPFLSRCHGPLAAVVTGLLNTHPRARPTAAQVRGLLAQATHTPPAGLTAPVPGHPGTARYQPPPRRRRTRPTVVLAVVLAVALLAGGYLLRVATEPADTGPVARDSALTYGEGGYLPELTWNPDYPAGGCLNSDLGQGRRITDSAQVECDDPHGLQVFETRTFWARPDEYSTGAVDLDYPGEAGLTGYAESVCTMVFGSNEVPDTRGLRYRALVPTRKGWDSGEREVVCVLYHEKGDQLDKSYVAGGE